MLQIKHTVNMIREKHLPFSSMVDSLWCMNDWICLTESDQQEKPAGDLFEKMSVLTLNKDWTTS